MSKLISIKHICQERRKRLTVICQLHEENDADFQTHDVQHEMTQVVGSNAVVNPGTVAITISFSIFITRSWEYLLVMFGNASSTTPAMLATQRFPDHTSNTEVLLVKLPLLEKFGNDGSLLIPASQFGNVPRILNNRDNEEESG